MQRFFRVGVAVGMVVLAAHGWGQGSHAPDGGSREQLQSITILPKPGAPFSAVVVTEWTRLLEDGSTTTMKNHRVVARDSEGRIFQERRYLSPTGDKDETELRALQYSDPVKHEYYDCDVSRRTCLVYRYNRRSEVGANLPAKTTLPGGRGTVTREDLGEKTIEGVGAVGSRKTIMINPGEDGYQHAEPTVKEFWYSPQLEVNVVTKRFEPRGGAQNFQLKQVSVDEPSAALFVPPSDYRIIPMDEGVQ